MGTPNLAVKIFHPYRPVFKGTKINLLIITLSQPKFRQKGHVSRLRHNLKLFGQFMCPDALVTEVIISPKRVKTAQPQYH
jgi:hypothetical protein